MGTKLFVGGLPWATTDDALQSFFAAAGTVTSAKVIVDKMTGKSRGFGFVEMSTPEEAQKAVNELNGKDLDGRQIIVNEAKPMEPRSGGQGGGHGGFRGGDRRDDRRGGYNKRNNY